MVSSYRRLLARPGVLYMIAVGLVVKLSGPVLNLALLLTAVDWLDSYAAAGLVLTGHALALALAAPVGGRLIDRFGARRVLAGYLAVHALAYVPLMFAQESHAAIMVGAAVLLGGTTPPAGAVIRTAWPRLVPAGSLATAYAMDNALNEVMFVVGPLLVPALLLAVPPHGVVAVAGVSLLIGTALLILSQRARQAPRNPPANSPRSWVSRVVGPLTHRTTVILLLLPGLGAFSFGCLRIATLASATVFGSPSSAGILMGLLSAGALAGALSFGARVWPIPGKRLLIALSVAEAASLLVEALAPGFLALAALITVTGLLTGPRDAVQPTLIADHAPQHNRTEVFAWLNTFMWAGYGLGTAAAGYLTDDRDGGGVAFGAAAAVALVAALLAAVGVPTSPSSIHSESKNTLSAQLPSGATQN